MDLDSNFNTLVSQSIKNFDKKRNLKLYFMLAKFLFCCLCFDNIEHLGL